MGKDKGKVPELRVTLPKIGQVVLPSVVLDGEGQSVQSTPSSVTTSSRVVAPDVVVRSKGLRRVRQKHPINVTI